MIDEWRLSTLRLLILRRIFFVTLFLFSFSLFGQGNLPRVPFSFKKFVDDNGTLSNIISCFLEDKEGFLWIGTANGLKRFDGDDFTIFKHEKDNPNSLSHSVVQSLCEDKLGRIWVGTGEGIGYFDKKTNQFFNLKEFHKSDNICFNILCDESNNIWFSIRGKGIFRYSEKTKKLQNFSHNPHDKNSINDNWIERKQMTLDPLKRGLWIETDEGLNFFEFSSNHFYNRGNNPKNLSVFKSTNVKGLATDENNLIFFDVDLQKISYFDTKKEQISKEVFLKNIFKNEKLEIRCIFVDKQHNLWLSDLFNYCYYYDIKNAKASRLENDPFTPTSIAANSFWCAYQQKDSSIWLGTNDGISITNPDHNFYEIYDLTSHYSQLKNENQLYLFLEDSADSTWWLAATQHNFVHYYPKSNQLKVYTVPQKPNYRNPAIEALIEYRNDIYVISSKSFYLFDKKKQKLTNLPLPDSMINQNHVSHAMQKGDSIWFFGNKPFAYSYKFSTKKWTYYPILGTSKMDVTCSEVDNNGDIWVTIYNTGLAKFSKQKQAFESVKILNDIAFRKAWYDALQKDSEGNFWVGSHYDLIKFNPKTKEFLKALDVNIIADMFVDKNDNIWTAAYNDITIYFPKIKKSLSETIPINKGNFNLSWRNSLYSLKNRQVVFLIKGVVVKIDPQKLIPASTKDKVLISKISLVNENILLHNNASFISLEASENGFGVYFSALNPPDAHKYKYYYQLEGHKNAWIVTSNNNAAFSNLDGGDYVFKVKGIDNNGYETPISTLNIHIDTIFYKSKKFLYGCIFLICALVYTFMRFRANQRSKIYHLKMQSTRLEKDKTEIQYQNLINHLNPHFLFNSLTSLNSLIMTEPKMASKFLQKLSLIYRYILQNKDKDVVSLEQELAFVKHYIDLQKSRFEEGLQINLNIESEYLTSKIVPVTLQNLFENAIKHNTVEEGTPLIISVLVEDDYLLVKNNLQRKQFVETSHKQGLESLKNLYKYLTSKPLETIETEEEFLVRVPLL